MLIKDKNSNIALIGTSIFHLLILLMLFYFGFKTPLPLPEEQGIVINFGNSDTGLGEEAIQNSANQATNQPVAKEENTENMLTQNIEETVALTKKETKQSNINDESKKEETQKINTAALYPGTDEQSNNKKSQGIAGGTGDQGDPSGSKEANNYEKGNGIGFSLTGRKAKKLPHPKYNIQEGGKVVVKITVDKNGNVIKAKAGERGSTSNNPELLRAAENAALQSKFDSNDNAPDEQIGTITYHFILN